MVFRASVSFHLHKMAQAVTSVCKCAAGGTRPAAHFPQAHWTGQRRLAHCVVEPATTSRFDAHLRKAQGKQSRGRTGGGLCFAGEAGKCSESGVAGMTRIVAPRKEVADVPVPVPYRAEESSASPSVADDAGLHPSWLQTILDGTVEPDRTEDAGLAPWQKVVREDTSWTYAPDLPRGLIGRQFGGVAMASLLLGLGFTLLAGTEAAHAVEHVSLRSQIGIESDMRAIAFGPEGPLVEEFWDNMRRYGFYFLTVASGGLYSLLKPILDLLKSPVSAVLVVTVVAGSFYLVYLTVSTMLGFGDFNYAYS